MARRVIFDGSGIADDNLVLPARLAAQMQLGTSVDPNSLNAYMKQASIFDG